MRQPQTLRPMPRRPTPLRRLRVQRLLRRPLPNLLLPPHLLLGREADPMTFEDLFKGIPGSADFVTGMPKVWPVSLLQDVYAPFGALHLVGLALMGGAVILLNLRLMGAGLVEEQP